MELDFSYPTGLPTEGSRGLNTLCCLAHELGFKDPFKQLSMSGGGCVGDLLVFFEDNPGAIAAVYEWISDQYQEELKELAPLDEDENNEDTVQGEELVNKPYICPDCGYNDGENKQNHIDDGEPCLNCKEWSAQYKKPFHMDIRSNEQIRQDIINAGRGRLVK
jgi:predicted Zn-ribbon and HTH transcriptional regulator